MLHLALALTGGTLLAFGTVALVVGAVAGHRDGTARAFVGFGLLVWVAFLIALAGAALA